MTTPSPLDGKPFDYILPFDTLTSSTKASDAYGTYGPTIEFIGSSNVNDMDRDVVTEEGLYKLAQAPMDLTTFIGHKYDFEHVLGKLCSAPQVVEMPPNDFGLIKAREPYKAVKLMSEVDTESPKAMHIHSLAKRSYKVGWSVGMFFEPGGVAPRKDQKGKTIGLLISGPLPYEWSATMIPSNQQSYSLAAKSLLKAKGILPADDDDEETSYVLKCLQDFSPEDAVMLLKIEQVLKEYGLKLQGV